MDEVAEKLRSMDLDVRVEDNTVIGIHRELPVGLIVRISGNEAIIEMWVGEDLRDAMEDVLGSGEDLMTLVDELMSELRDDAIAVSKILESRGFKVKINLRDRESDVRDLAEEVIEEYG